MNIRPFRKLSEPRIRAGDYLSQASEVGGAFDFKEEVTPEVLAVLEKLFTEEVDIQVANEYRDKIHIASRLQVLMPGFPVEQCYESDLFFRAFGALDYQNDLGRSAILQNCLFLSPDKRALLPLSEELRLKVLSDIRRVRADGPSVYPFLKFVTAYRAAWPDKPSPVCQVDVLSVSSKLFDTPVSRRDFTSDRYFMLMLVAAGIEHVPEVPKDFIEHWRKNLHSGIILAEKRAKFAPFVGQGSLFHLKQLLDDAVALAIVDGLRPRISSSGELVLERQDQGSCSSSLPERGVV